VHQLRAAEFHWHFAQGIRAVEQELYIPGSLALLAGIETSIRLTLYQSKQNTFPFEQDLGTVLSNSLIRQARDNGLPIALLAFPGEADFADRLDTNKPGVRIVELRNDLAHGNVQRFVNRELGDSDAFFTPECLRELSLELLAISVAWSEALAMYRAAKSISSHQQEL